MTTTTAITKTRQKKVSEADVIEALRQSDGIQTQAAKLLGVDRTTIYRYLQNNESLRQAYQEINEAMLDCAENELIQKVKEGDVSCIQFYLRTKGAHRGYGNKVTHDGAIDDKPKNKEIVLKVMKPPKRDKDGWPIEEGEVVKVLKFGPPD